MPSIKAEFHENEAIDEFPKEWLDASSEFTYPLHSHICVTLNELAKRNTVADSDADEIMELLECIENEYSAAYMESFSTLGQLHLMPVNMPKSMQSILQKSLDVLNNDLNSCRLSRDFEHRLQAADEMKTKRKIVKMRGTNARLQKLNDKMKTELTIANKETEDLKETTDEKYKRIEFYNIKEQEYVQKLTSAINDLTKAGIRDTGLYNSLVKINEDIKLKEEQISGLNTEMKQYYDLPPNLTLAQDKLAKAKQEFDELSRKLREKISNTLTLNN